MSRLGMAWRRIRRPFDGRHDIPQRKLEHISSQRDATSRTPHGLDKPRLDKPTYDAADKRNREMPILGQVRNGNSPPILVVGQMQDDSQRVVGLSRYGEH
jgi:hypothetical protein